MTQEIIPPPKKGAKTCSLRAQLRLMQELRRQAEAGERGVAEANVLHQMAEREGNVILGMLHLQVAGVDDQVSIDLRPGEEFEPPALGVHRKQKIRHKESVTQYGPMSETVVTIESSGDDAAAKIDAQVKAIS